jgi:hypothetical protein
MKMTRRSPDERMRKAADCLSRITFYFRTKRYWSLSHHWFRVPGSEFQVSSFYLLVCFYFRVKDVDRAVAGQPIDIRSSLLLKVVTKPQIASKIKAGADEKERHT